MKYEENEDIINALLPSIVLIIVYAMLLATNSTTEGDMFGEILTLVIFYLISVKKFFDYSRGKRVCRIKKLELYYAFVLLLPFFFIIVVLLKCGITWGLNPMPWT